MSCHIDDVIAPIMGYKTSIREIISKSDFSPYTKDVVTKMLSSKKTRTLELPNKKIDTPMYMIYTYQSLLLDGNIEATYNITSPRDLVEKSIVNIRDGNNIIPRDELIRRLQLTDSLDTSSQHHPLSEGSHDNIIRMIFQYLGPALTTPGILLDVKRKPDSILDYGFGLCRMFTFKDNITLIPTQSDTTSTPFTYTSLSNFVSLKGGFTVTTVGAEGCMLYNWIGHKLIPGNVDYQSVMVGSKTNPFITTDDTKYQHAMVYNERVKKLLDLMTDVANYNKDYQPYVKLIKLMIYTEHHRHINSWVGKKDIYINPIDKNATLSPINERIAMNCVNSIFTDVKLEDTGILTEASLAQAYANRQSTNAKAAADTYTANTGELNRAMSTDSIYNSSRQAAMSAKYKANSFLQYVIGMPPRFPAIADSRVNINATEPTPYDLYGRVYTENFIQYGSYVSFTPCYPKFAPKLSQAQVAAIMSQTPEAIDTAMNEKAQGTQNWTLFGVEYAGRAYKNITTGLVKLACDLFKYDTDGDDMVDKLIDTGTKYDLFGFDMGALLSNKEAKDAKGNKMEKGLFTNVIIYNNGPIEYSENISNSVGDSTIMGMLTNSQISDIAREVSYLMRGKDTSAVVSTTTLDKTASFLRSILSFGQSTQNMLAGQLKVPKVWKNSDYTKSFNIKIRLTSPSGHPKVVFRRIIIPMIQMLPFMLPQQYTGAAFTTDSVIAPFIIQVYSKGLLACEMGMVTGMEINRFVETQTIDGLPTEMEINLHIEDLTPFLSVPTSDKVITRADYHVSGIVPFISTMAGIPLYRSDDQSILKTRIEQFVNFISQTVKSPGRAIIDLQTEMKQFIYNIARDRQ